MEKQAVWQPAGVLACKQAKLVFQIQFEKLTICCFQKQHNQAIVRQTRNKRLGRYLFPCRVQSTAPLSPCRGCYWKPVTKSLCFPTWTLSLPAGLKCNSNTQTEVHTNKHLDVLITLPVCPLIICSCRRESLE